MRCDGTYLDPPIQHISDVCYPAAEVKIACRAVADASVPALDEVKLGIFQVNSMSEDCLLPQETKLVVYAGIRLAIGEKFPSEGYLGRVLADVGLDGHVRVLRCEGAQALKQIVAARNCKAWGEDGLDERVLEAANMGDEGFGIGKRLSGRRFLIRRRSVAVHVAFL